MKNNDIRVSLCSVPVEGVGSIRQILKSGL